MPLVRRVLAVASLCFAGSAFAADLPPAADRVVNFKKDVLPIFQKHCWKCHGSEKREGGLRLDHDDALDGGDSGPSILKKRSAESSLIRKVAGLDKDSIMPPEDEGERLTPAEIGILRKWIDDGATWPADAGDGSKRSEHWSYQPILRVNAPKVREQNWVRNPIDAFVLAKLEAQQIKPSPEADPQTLIRRLNLDLLGLPPTPEEVDGFVAAPQREAAYEQLVDRLLASPHFGERWGRHWLDMARYADTDGYEKDNSRPDAWRWRDWVIDAVNRDLPFDQFTTEQLAGDLLPDASDMQRLATAFNRQTLTNTEGGTDKEEFRVEACFDRVETMGAVWLGLTLTCARCHSHKYEAISQREYFAMFAFFNNGDETSTEVPISAKAVAKYQLDMIAHTAKLEKLSADLAAAKRSLEPELAAWATSMRESLKSPAQVEFHPLDFTDLKAASKATFQRLDDGSYRVSGKSPERDEYTLTAKIDLKDISGLKIESIPDESLPTKGAGRSKNGNFVLTDVRAYLGSKEKLVATDAVSLTGATADFSQKNFPADMAIDANKQTTGWAVLPQVTRSHAATFALRANTAQSNATWLQVVLDHQYGQQHTLGRFRVSARTGSDPRESLSAQVLKALELSPDQWTDSDRTALLEEFSRRHAATSKLAAEVDAHQAAAPKKPEMSVRVISERRNDPRHTYVMRRGSFLDPIREQETASGTPSLLPRIEPKNSHIPDRIDLANWLMSKENPLTARVTANHIWRLLFGEGLVRTVNDFGVRGEKPSHPELLDWLATEFRDELAWSRKKFIKRIVMSATYRQSAAHRPELVEVDPLNTWLARQNRLRVEAELMRDLTLSVSGLLSTKIGGPSVFPPMPAGITDLSYASNFKWATSTGEDRYRRAMYTFFKRTAPHPNLTTFDCPDANTTNVKRQTSNTPLQALVLLNNESFMEAAQAFGQRLLKHEAATDSERLQYGFRLCVARPMNGTETNQFAVLLVRAREFYSEHPVEAQDIVGKYKVDGQSLAEVAAWITTSRVLLNLDEFITRN